MNELKTKIKNHTFIIKIKLSIPELYTKSKYKGKSKNYAPHFSTAHLRNEEKSTSRSSIKYIPRNIMATNPKYFDDGRGSSAHVFLRTSDERMLLFTANVLVILSIFSPTETEVSSLKETHVKSREIKMHLSDQIAFSPKICMC